MIVSAGPYQSFLRKSEKIVRCTNSDLGWTLAIITMLAWSSWPESPIENSDKADAHDNQPFLTQTGNQFICGHIRAFYFRCLPLIFMKLIIAAFT